MTITTPYSPAELAFIAAQSAKNIADFFRDELEAIREGKSIPKRVSLSFRNHGLLKGKTSYRTLTEKAESLLKELRG